MCFSFFSYPTKSFYFKAVSLLLQKYPALADVTGTGHESWTIALRNKFKNERRKLTGDAAVEQQREKYGKASRKRSANEAHLSGDVLQRVKAPKHLVSLLNC